MASHVGRFRAHLGKGVTDSFTARSRLFELDSTMNSKRSEIDDFGEFVKRQQAGSAEAERTDWAAERDEWLGRLKELYDQTESFLTDYIKSAEIKINYRDIELNEENIGSYTTRQMVLKIGRQEITMTPIGTLFLYTKGRVDVVGPAGRTHLLLVDREASGPPRKVTISIGKPESPAAQGAPKRIKWAWKIATRPPSIQYIELTQQSFFQALMEVANG